MTSVGDENISARGAVSRWHAHIALVDRDIAYRRQSGARAAPTSTGAGACGPRPRGSRLRPAVALGGGPRERTGGHRGAPPSDRGTPGEVAASQAKWRPGAGKQPTKRPSPCHLSTTLGKRAAGDRTMKTTTRLTEAECLTTPVRAVGHLRARPARRGTPRPWERGYFASSGAQQSDGAADPVALRNFMAQYGTPLPWTPPAPVPTFGQLPNYFGAGSYTPPWSPNMSAAMAP